MSDPLSLVRQATITGTAVNYSDGHYIFGEHKFHENSKTFFKRSLKYVIFFLENAEITVADYRRKAVETRTTAVVEQDRQALKNYLTGIVDTCVQIDLAAAASFAKEASALQESKDVPHVSVEKMQEQRQKHAAMLDKTVSKSKAEGETSDNLDELKELRKSLKRKADGSGGEEGEDRAYIEADRAILAKLRADETPAQTRSTVLCAANTDFVMALKLFNDKILKPKDGKAGDPRSSSSAAPAPAAAPMSDRVAAANRAALNRDDVIVTPKVRPTPIIIVPSAVTSCITAVNASDFLVQGQFIPGDVKKQQGGRREKEQVIVRPSNATNRSQPYKIIDDPVNLSAEDWQRVVAVFVTGQLWQFKGWKYATPVDLFQHVLGVHLTYDDRVIDPTVLTWNCKVLKVNQFKQHVNSAAGREFWMYLDDFVRLRKPHLRPLAQGEGVPIGSASASSGK